MEQTGRVQACWRYPVKSMQGVEVDHLVVTATGVEGDRTWGLIDGETGRLMSAKRFSRLLEAAADDEAVTMPDGRRVATGEADEALSAWLGRPVTVAEAAATTGAAYQMTLDPANDDADLFDIPTPERAFVDLAAVHLVTTATLDHCATTRPDLDWDVRRFRPNLVVALDGEAGGFTEGGWAGREVTVGDAVLRGRQPTIRCAMPLRAQPGGLDRQPEMFAAMTELNDTHPNHLGLYLDVVTPGVVRAGDPVRVAG